MSRLTYLSAGLISSLLALPCWADGNPVTIAIDSPNAQLLHVQMKTPTGQQDIQDYLLSPGQTSQDVYLHDGAGTYDVTWWLGDQPNPRQGSLTYGGEESIDNTDTRSGFALPSGYVESDNPEIVALARKITDGKQTDADKALAIHNWVASNIRYDVEAYFKGTYINNMYDAVSVLHAGTAVCAGYADLYAALGRAAGLQVKVIQGAIIWPLMGQTWETTGETQEHDWNEVLIDNRWVIVDTTWDSGYIDGRTQKYVTKLQETYFDPIPVEFAGDHHKKKELDS